MRQSSYQAFIIKALNIYKPQYALEPAAISEKCMALFRISPNFIL
jgi:hypothetical protein